MIYVGLPDAKIQLLIILIWTKYFMNICSSG